MPLSKFSYILLYSLVQEKVTVRSALSRLIRPRSLERRLFLWLTLVALIPSLSVLAIASWAGREAAGWVGASGSWTRVAESGRVLIEAAEQHPDNPELRAAADTHRRQLSTSLTQARRWEFVGTRLRTLFPLFLLTLALFGSLIALGVARHVARQVSRPARELVQWTHLLANEEPLPAPQPREEREAKELRRLRAALRQASEDLQRARARALEAERVKSWGEMARRVAHEMKNPLTPLRLAAHRLQRAQGSPELEESLSVIGEETQRLEELAASFAMLGRPAEGPRSAVDVRELLERLLASDVPSHVQVALQGEAQAQLVEADYNALLQAFRNIVRNAVEAVEQNGRIRNITVKVSRAENGRVRVSVRDTGPGISEEAQRRLFEPDFTSKTRGTGLGLAVARQTIRLHGGDILARNTENGGAEFIVELPLFEEQA
jgi:nitrogen fixation/metabolism regulation signal transduction histidine kinase